MSAPEAMARPEADDPRQHVARILRRHGEELRLGIAEYRGRRYADIRSYYLDDAGEWRPGRGGEQRREGGISCPP